MRKRVCNWWPDRGRIIFACGLNWPDSTPVCDVEYCPRCGGKIPKVGDR